MNNLSHKDKKFAVQGKRHRNRNDIAFTDMILNMFMRAIIMVALLLIMFSPAEKKDQGPPETTDALVIMTWNDCSDVDVDMWIRDPNGTVVSYVVRQAGLMSLDHDDQGYQTDSQIVNGVQVKTCVRKEVVSIHALLEGEYVVNGYIYATRDGTNPIKVKVSVITLNPYSEIFTREIDYTQAGQEFTFAHLFFGKGKTFLRSDMTPEVSLYGPGPGVTSEFGSGGTGGSHPSQSTEGSSHL